MQILIGLIVLILVITFFITKTGTVSPRTKTMIFTMLMMVIAAAMLYEFMFSKKAEVQRAKMNAFTQGQTLLCKQIEVNQTYFTLETGTLSLMSNGKSKETLGMVFPIDECSIKE